MLGCANQHLFEENSDPVKIRLNKIKIMQISLAKNTAKFVYGLMRIISPADFAP